MKTSSLSIIIPCFNEEKILSFSIDTLLNYLNPKNLNYELIIVDDGSSDNTFNIACGYSKKNTRIKAYKTEKNFGKGHAVRYGIEKSNNDILFFIDADITYDLSAIEEMLKIYEETNTVMVCGSRHLKNNKTYNKFPLLRQITGYIFSLIIRFFLFSDVVDSQCGFKSIKSNIIKQIAKNFTINRFGYDMELLYYVKKVLRHKVVFIPVNPVIIRNESKVNIISDSIIMILDIIKIKFNFFFKNNSKKNNISSIISGSYQFEALNKGNIIQKFWHKEKNLIAKKILKKYNSYFVLDAGSGAGNFFYINKNDFKIISIDKNFYSCLFIKKNGGKSIQCDLCYLPFKKNIFDTIVSQDVIEHLNNIQSDKMMDEFLKILKNEGLIFIVTPNYSSIWILVEKAVDLFNLLPSLEQQHFQKFNIPFLEKLKKQSLIKLETGSFFLLSPILSIFSYNIASKFSIFELKKIRFGALCYIVFKNKISDSIKNSIINNNN